MRFKTKDLMINVEPELAGPARQQRYQRFDPNWCIVTRCFIPSWMCDHTSLRPCDYLSNMCHPTACRPTWIPCGCTDIYIDEAIMTVQYVTPHVATQTQYLDYFRQQLTDTLARVEQHEASVTAAGSLAEAERVEAGLQEALAQVRAQKKALARKAPAKKG